MPTALILGIDGQDGSYLAELLLKKGYAVVGWVPENLRVSFNNLDHIQESIQVVKGDLRSQSSLDTCIETYKPDEIYNLASPSAPAKSWESVIETGDVTALGVARLLEAIRHHHPEAKLYQASSSELFGNPVEVPQNENTPFHPRNPYGIAKLHAHWLIVNYRQKYGLFAVSGILFNHESPRRGLNFVTRKITNGAVKIKLGLADELELGNLNAKRDWGFAGDYVHAMWLMLQQDEPQDFVIGTGKTHSVGELCVAAFGYLNLNYQDYVIVAPKFYRPNEAKTLVADCSKAKTRLGWTPQVSFEELIQMMVASDLNGYSQ
jgi:GDPmannose 4,6-dehydratase